MPEQRPDERVEAIRRLVSMTDEELFSLPADERIGMPMEIAALVPSLLNAYDEQRARAERAEQRAAVYEGHLKKLTILMQRAPLHPESLAVMDEVLNEMLERFWTTPAGSDWLDQLEAMRDGFAPTAAADDESGQ